MMARDITFRPAGRADCALILRFIKELAEYEHLLHEVTATEQLLEEWLFDKRAAEVLFVLADGQEVGYALFFHNFSTFLGRAGIYLEDLYVAPEFRGRGIGKAFLRELARITMERMPETYGALTEMQPEILRNRYNKYEYARTQEAMKDIADQYDAYKQDAFDGKPLKLDYDW